MQVSIALSNPHLQHTHVGQYDEDRPPTEGHVMVVPLQEFQIAVQEILAIELGIRGDEELSNLVELSNIDIGALGNIVIAISRSPKRRTIILWDNRKGSAWSDRVGDKMTFRLTGSPRPARSPLPSSCSSP